MKESLARLLKEISAATSVARDLVEENRMIETASVEYHWSRRPGRFLNKVTGEREPWGTFNGTVREWYETLVEVIIDVDNTLQRKEIYAKDHAHIDLFTGPDVSTILEASVLYKPSLYNEDLVGRLCNRYGVFRDDVVPMNQIYLVVVPDDWRLPRRLGGIIHVEEFWGNED